jgi:hypothetical protein
LCSNKVPFVQNFFFILQNIFSWLSLGKIKRGDGEKKEGMGEKKPQK